MAGRGAVRCRPSGPWTLMLHRLVPRPGGRLGLRQEHPAATHRGVPAATDGYATVSGTARAARCRGRRRRAATPVPAALGRRHRRPGADLRLAWQGGPARCVGGLWRRVGLAEADGKAAAYFWVVISARGCCGAHPAAAARQLFAAWNVRDPCERLQRKTSCSARHADWPDQRVRHAQRTKRCSWGRASSCSPPARSRFDLRVAHLPRSPGVDPDELRARQLKLRAQAGRGGDHVPSTPRRRYAIS